MNANLSATLRWIVLAAFVIAIAAFSLREVLATGRLRDQLKLERIAARGLAPVENERARLTALAATAPAPGEAAALHDERARLQRELEALAAVTPRAAAGVPTTSAPPQPSPWRNAGNATAAAAFESTMWSSTSGDWPALAALIGFDTAALAEADTFFAAVPSDMREQYGSREALVAAVMAGKLPAGIEKADVLAENVQPDGSAVLRVRLSETNRPPREVNLRFARAADGSGWRLLVPRTIVAGYRYAVTGASAIGAPPPANP